MDLPVADVDLSPEVEVKGRIDGGIDGGIDSGRSANSPCLHQNCRCLYSMK